MQIAVVDHAVAVAARTTPVDRATDAFETVARIGTRRLPTSKSQREDFGKARDELSALLGQMMGPQSTHHALQGLAQIHSSLYKLPPRATRVATVQAVADVLRGVADLTGTGGSARTVAARVAVLDHTARTASDLAEYGAPALEAQSREIAAVADGLRAQLDGDEDAFVRHVAGRRTGGTPGPRAQVVDERVAGARAALAVMPLVHDEQRVAAFADGIATLETRHAALTDAVRELARELAGGVASPGLAHVRAMHSAQRRHDELVSAVELLLQEGEHVRNHLTWVATKLAASVEVERHLGRGDHALTRRLEDAYERIVAAVPGVADETAKSSYAKQAAQTPQILANARALRDRIHDDAPRFEHLARMFAGSRLVQLLAERHTTGTYAPEHIARVAETAATWLDTAPQFAPGLLTSDWLDQMLRPMFHHAGNVSTALAALDRLFERMPDIERVFALEQNVDAHARLARWIRLASTVEHAPGTPMATTAWAAEDVRSVRDDLDRELVQHLRSMLLAPDSRRFGDAGEDVVREARDSRAKALHATEHLLMEHPATTPAALLGFVDSVVGSGRAAGSERLAQLRTQLREANHALARDLGPHLAPLAPGALGRALPDDAHLVAAANRLVQLRSEILDELRRHPAVWPDGVADIRQLAEDLRGGMGDDALTTQLDARLDALGERYSVPLAHAPEPTRAAGGGAAPTLGATLLATLHDSAQALSSSAVVRLRAMQTTATIAARQHVDPADNLSRIDRAAGQRGGARVRSSAAQATREHDRAVIAAAATVDLGREQLLDAVERYASQLPTHAGDASLPHGTGELEAARDALQQAMRELRERLAALDARRASRPA